MMTTPYFTPCETPTDTGTILSVPLGFTMPSVTIAPLPPYIKPNQLDDDESKTDDDDMDGEVTTAPKGYFPRERGALEEAFKSMGTEWND
jgi:hypothetical protein